MAQALSKGLALLDRILVNERGANLNEMTADLGLPPSTVYRLLATLEERQLVARVSAGRYVAGPAIQRYALSVDPLEVLAQIGRPTLRDASTALGQTMHLSVFRSDMVTYLVKESVGDSPIFTREQNQLEAYCSAVGKTLLADLEPVHLEAYLSNGSFVPLTERTITDPGVLRSHLRDIAAAGFAFDNGEMLDGMTCCAVPIRDAQGGVCAAISACSYRAVGTKPVAERLTVLRRASRIIERGLQKVDQAATRSIAERNAAAASRARVAKTSSAYVLGRS